jgi:UDPglucose 6-dehydrogenase
MKVAIAGMGTVGRAVYHGFSPVIDDLKCYDTGRNLGDIGYLREADFVFICVPAEAVHDLVCEISEGTNRRDIVFILKSTVLPGTTDDLQHICGHHWVFNPEFLTDRTADLDFINSPNIILGGTGGPAVQRVEELYRLRFRHTPIHKTTAKSAEFVKYMVNLFFTTKISFMNEMFNASNELGLPWDSIIKMFSADGRIANSHLDVPGPDGQMGFGGKCFPENINTYIDFTNDRRIDNDLIKAVRMVNDIYRND